MPKSPLVLSMQTEIHDPGHRVDAVTRGMEVVAARLGPGACVAWSRRVLSPVTVRFSINAGPLWEVPLLRLLDGPRGLWMLEPGEAD
jgi:hypothetical protein